MNKEKGQATIELITIMLAITACMLGVLFVGGIVVSNNNRLLESKFEAEREARKPDASHSPDQRNEYASWHGDSGLNSYLQSLFHTSDDFNLPFGLDYTSRSSSRNTLEGLEQKLKDPTASKLPNHFQWEETQFYNSRFSSSLTGITSNAFNAAQLVNGQVFSTSGDKDLDDFADKKLQNAAQSWMGITVKNSKIRNNPSNKVFMPKIRPDKKLME